MRTGRTIPSECMVPKSELWCCGAEGAQGGRAIESDFRVSGQGGSEGSVPLLKDWMGKMKRERVTI